MPCRSSVGLPASALSATEGVRVLSGEDKGGRAVVAPRERPSDQSPPGGVRAAAEAWGRTPLPSGPARGGGWGRWFARGAGRGACGGGEVGNFPAWAGGWPRQNVVRGDGAEGVGHDHRLDPGGEGLADAGVDDVADSGVPQVLVDVV